VFNEGGLPSAPYVLNPPVRDHNGGLRTPVNEMMGQIINALSGEKDRRRAIQGEAQQFPGFDYERYNSHNISA